MRLEIYLDNNRTRLLPLTYFPHQIDEPYYLKIFPEIRRDFLTSPLPSTYCNDSIPFSYHPPNFPKKFSTSTNFSNFQFLEAKISTLPKTGNKFFGFRFSRVKIFWKLLLSCAKKFSISKNWISYVYQKIPTPFCMYTKNSGYHFHV